MTTLDFDQSLAIVIGINQYGHGIAPLRTAVADAEAIAQILEQDHGYQVISLLDKQAQLSALQTLITETLPNLLTANSRLLLYFAGHGIAQDGDDGPAGYLIPQNARPGKIDSYLPMVEFHDALTALPCRHFLAVFDCCFAGAFRWSSTRDIDFVPEVIHQERFDRFRQDPAWQVITSASYDQKAMDVLSLRDDRGELTDQHSPFASALLDALKGFADAFPPAQDGQRAGDGVITATELYLYLRDRVELITEGQRKRQTPELCPLRKHDKGEFIFLTPGHELNLPPAPELNIENNPYRGLESFDPEDHKLFFGRDEEIDQLLKRLETPHPFTVVLGASGTGKSSLVKAGLLPSLAQQQPEFHILPVLRPGAEPLEALARTLAMLVPDEDIQELTQSFAQDEEALAEKIGRWHQAHSDQKLLLVLDQTEELITQTTDPREAFQFQRLLKRTMAAHWEFVWIIATLRLDFESQFQEEALKEAWMDSRFVIPPMSQAQLRAAIELPAAARVLHFEPSSLVDRLIEDVSQTPGALPLLSFTLSEMYLRYLERRSDNRALTEEDYRALGGVTGSLTQRATQEYEGLVATDAAYEQTVKHVMLRMLAVEGGELARRRVPLSELVYGNEAENQRVQTLLQTLVDARLIVRGQEGEGSEPYVEPAHDALVRGWDKLLRWKNEEQEAIALQRRLSPAAQEWALQKANKRAKGLLWNDNPRLGLLKEVMASPQNWLNQVESTFVAASVKLRRTKQRRFVGSLGSVIIALSLLSVGLVEASRNFFVSSQRNFARSLAAEADSLVSKSSVKQETGALLAVRAHQIMQNLGEESAEVNQVLRKSLEVLPDNQLLTHGESVNVVAFSSDGNSLATASDDGTAKIWTSALPEPLSESFEPDNISAEGLEETFAEAHTLEHGGKVRAIAFNPNRDRSQVVTAGDNKIAQVWDTTTGERLGQVTHQRPVSLAMFSPGKDEGAGKLVATASDLNVLVWEAMTGEGTFAFTAKKPITAMSFSPDGKRIAIARGKGNVGIWSLETQKEVFSLDYLSEIHALAFSPDGKRLATASENRLAIVVNIQSDAKQFPDAEQQSDAKQFPDTEQQSDEKQSSDTKQQSDEEQSLDAKQQSGEKQSSDTKQQSDEKQSSDERQLAGLKLRHQSVVKDVAFSPDGKRIATASYDETARVWDALTGDPIAKFDHEDEVKTVSFSPDGNRLATTSWNEAAQVWDIETGKASETLSHKELVTAVSFSDNSARVATASKDGTAKVWNTMAPTADHQLVHEEAVRGVSFSPNEDDSRVVTASDDKTVKVWDSQTGELMRTLPHPSSVRVVNLTDNNRRIVTASDDDMVRVWDETSDEPIFELQHHDTVLSANFSPDGTLIVTTNVDKRARIWDEAGSLVAKLDHYGVVRSANFNQEGTLIATASHDKRARIWSVEGKAIRSLGHKDPVREAVFSPNGQYLATVSNNNSADLWDLQTGKRIFRPGGHRKWVNTVAFSPDSKRLVTGSRDRTAKVWDIASEKELASLNHRRSVNTVRFSQQDNQILTASADGTAKVWDADTGRAVVAIAHEAEVIAASFSPDGSQIATASKDLRAKVNDTDSDAIAQRVCDRVRSNPTADDWIQYIKPDEKSKFKSIQKYELVCENNPLHPSVIAFGQKLAQSESRRQRRQSIALFRRVLKLSPTSDLDPSTPEELDQDPVKTADKFYALHVVQQGEESAIYGDLKKARSLFKKALALDEDIDLTPATDEVDKKPEEVAEELKEAAEEDFELEDAENVDDFDDDAITLEEEFEEEYYHFVDENGELVFVNENGELIHEDGSSFTGDVYVVDDSDYFIDEDGFFVDEYGNYIDDGNVFHDGDDYAVVVDDGYENYGGESSGSEEEYRANENYGTEGGSTTGPVDGGAGAGESNNSTAGGTATSPDEGSGSSGSEPSNPSEGEGTGFAGTEPSIPPEGGDSGVSDSSSNATEGDAITSPEETVNSVPDQGAPPSEAF